MAGTRGNHLLAVYVGIPSEIEDEFNKETVVKTPGLSSPCMME